MWACMHLDTCIKINICYVSIKRLVARSMNLITRMEELIMTLMHIQNVSWNYTVCDKTNATITIHTKLLSRPQRHFIEGLLFDLFERLETLALSVKRVFKATDNSFISFPWWYSLDNYKKNETKWKSTSLIAVFLF